MKRKKNREKHFLLVKRTLKVLLSSQVSIYNTTVLGFPGFSVVENQLPRQEAWSLIYRLQRSPGKRNVNPLQYSCLSNPKDRGLAGYGPQKSLHDRACTGTAVLAIVIVLYIMSPSIYLTTGICTFLTSFSIPYPHDHTPLVSPNVISFSTSFFLSFSDSHMSKILIVFFL